MRAALLIAIFYLAGCSVIYISGDENNVTDDKDRGIMIDAPDE